MTDEPLSKKIKLVDSSDPASKQREAETQAAVEKIDAIQSELDALNDKASEEILQVERKYNKLREPYYNKRSGDIAAINGFWVTAFLNHPQISTLLTEEDEKALVHLENLSVKENEDIKSGYKVVFTFRENPYFTNKVIEKEIKLNEEGELVGSATKIDWKSGQSLCTVPQSEAGGGESFFQWFSEEASSGLGQDELGEIIKDDIWPNPLQYYLATEEGDEDGEDYGDEDDDEEDGEGDEGEEEEEAAAQ